MQNHLIRSPLLDSISGLTYGFTTLKQSPSERERIENKTATAKQVHKADLLILDQWEKRAREADAVATFQPSLPVGVFSADCTPILVVALSEASRKVIGVMAIHAGWRGTALGIAGSSLREFSKAAEQREKNLHFVAAIGPCISFASFEVGKEVVDAFPDSEKRGLARFLREEAGRPKFLFDLVGENSRQLREVARARQFPLELDPVGLCTVKETALLPSFRREKSQAGRILSFLEFHG